MTAVAATTMAVKTAMDCKGDGVVGNYGSNSGVGYSDNDNGGGGNSEGGGHIPQSSKAAVEESAAAVMVMAAATATETTIN